MKLRNIFLGSTILMVSLAFIALAATLYSAHTDEMKERARLHIEQTYRLFMDHVNLKIESIVSGVERVDRPLHTALDAFARRAWNQAEAQPLAQIQQRLPMLVPMLTELRSLAGKLGEEHTRLALYGRSGTLLLVYQAEQATELTLSLYLPEVFEDRLIVLRKERKLVWEKNTTKLLDESHVSKAKGLEQLSTIPLPADLPARLAVRQPGETSVDFATLGGLAAIRAQAPIAGDREGVLYFVADAAPKHKSAAVPVAGTIDVTLQISVSDIAKVSAMMSTHVNAFINERLAAGTLSMYSQTEAQTDPPLSLQEHLSGQPLRAIETIAINAQNYYESRIGIRGDFSGSLSLSILESRLAEEQAIAAFLKKMGLIALLFGVVFYVMIYLLDKKLVSPIVAMQKTINGLAMGRIERASDTHKTTWIHEVKAIETSLDKFVAVDQKIATLADHVAGGHFDVAIEQRSDEDILVKALNRMVQRLQAQKQQIDESSRELEKLAHTDGLTGIVNRRHFDQMLAYNFSIAARNHIPLAVLIVDIDYFKKYNDHFGHQGGDTCLVQVAQALERCAQRHNDIVARYGGEEFGIIALGSDQQQAEYLATSLCEAVAALQLDHPLSEHLKVTVSVGACSLVPKDAQASDVLKMADDALYLAKKQGRNRAAMAPSR